MTTLITNGTVVSATGSSPAGRPRRRRDHRRGPGPRLAARSARSRPRPNGHRRRRQAGHPRRHRRPHPHGDAVRWHLRLGHLRDRVAGRGVGRHHDDHRLRRAGPRAAGPGPGRALAREGRRQLRHRLRLPPDHRRRQRRVAQGDGRADRRGHHELQALHGLPRCLPVLGRADRAGHADRRRQRQPDHDACRKRFGHRRSRPTGASLAATPRRTSTASPGPGRPSRRRPTAR